MLAQARVVDFFAIKINKYLLFCQRSAGRLISVIVTFSINQKYEVPSPVTIFIDVSNETPARLGDLVIFQYIRNKIVFHRVIEFYKPFVFIVFVHSNATVSLAPFKYVSKMHCYYLPIAVFICHILGSLY